MKLNILLLICCLTMLPMLTLSAQNRNESPPPQNNTYGIEPARLYSGSLVLELLHTAETEIDKAVKEAYEAGYKAATLQSAPDAAYWKRLNESLRLELEREKGKNIRNGFVFGFGGIALGVLSIGIYSLARKNR